MYAITGITGQVGGAVARCLLEANQPVRAIVRSAGKGKPWAELGCEVAIVADIADVAALISAFTGMEGVFVLLPPVFDPSPGFPEARAIIAALKAALLAARPAKVVCLSTIGAQASRPNLLTQLGLMEEELRTLPLPVAFLRAAWFMENAAWDVAPVRETGILSSFLQPLDKPVPMVATADIGRLAAELLQETWQGPRIVELEGPERVTPDMVADIFGRILGRPVHAEAVPHDTWQTLFASQGMANPIPRMQMLDGFNEGWIEFETEARTLKGVTPLETVLRGLTDGSGF
jgi:uncharacterized protein YbjT (DUF2867 family)